MIVEYYAEAMVTQMSHSFDYDAETQRTLKEINACQNDIDALNKKVHRWPKTIFYHYGAEIPIEEIRFPMAIPNGHLEWFYYHIW